MKSLMIALSMFICTQAFANPNLTFKSKNLNRVVAIFGKYSPDLVKNGEVGYTYCGQSGAEFSLKKATAQEIAGKYIYNAYLANLDEVAFAALELNDDQLSALKEEIMSATNYDFPNLSMGFMSTYTIDSDGVITNHAHDPSYLAFHDIQTNEYLLAQGAAWQDDCD